MPRQHLLKSVPAEILPEGVLVNLVFLNTRTDRSLFGSPAQFLVDIR